MYMREKLFVLTRDQIREKHATWLKNVRCVKYWWIPYTDSVVVTLVDVCDKDEKISNPQQSMYIRCAPLRDLLKLELAKRGQPMPGELLNANFAQLRDMILELDPTNTDLIIRTNKAEEKFWKLSEGDRIDDSKMILGFECGGSQWVLENCIPTGTIEQPNLKDLTYMEDILYTIETLKLPAASPIEQRWSAASASYMSPTYSENKSDIFSWIGVIMYISNQDQQKIIREKFKLYAGRHADLTLRYDGVFHWGKIDASLFPLEKLQEALRKRFDLVRFAVARKRYDPKNILGSDKLDALLDYQ